MYIKLYVNADAKREVFIARNENTFDVSVKEPAERNLANTRAMELIARHFGIAVGKVKIVNGHHSPSKLLRVDVDKAE